MVKTKRCSPLNRAALDGTLRNCTKFEDIDVNHTIIKNTLLGLPLLMLSACSSVSVDKLWPFDGKSSPAQARTPANSTEYQCDAGKHFYVRYLDNGATAWLIYPDREVSLAKASSGTRYTNGVAVLELNGNEAKLNDGTTIAYTGCKSEAKSAK